MIEEKRRELAELSAKLERKRKTDDMLQSLHHEETDLNQRLHSIKAILTKEEADVARLQRTSAASIFYSMLGNKDLKLSKEKQEVYAAKLKHDAAVCQLTDCKMRMNDISLERDALSDCAERYDQVFAELKELLREDPTYAEKLCGLERQRGEAVGQLKELGEAILAGNTAMDQIVCIENSLGSAEGWGTWDLLGGGLISDMAKHSHLDEAQEGAEYLQVLLSRFHTELADVYINSDLGAVNVDGFLRFADYFFDGLIADWSVLSRIQESQESIDQVKCQVDDALSKLSAIKNDRIAQKAAVEQQITDLVSSI